MTRRRTWLFGFSLLLLAPHVAEAKQCVWNNGAYIARVEWYAPQDMVLAAIDAEGTTHLAPGFEDTGQRSSATGTLRVADDKVWIPGSVKRSGSSLEDVTVRLKRNDEPVQVDQFPAGAGRCIGRPGGPYTAVVGAVGRTGLANATRGFVGTLWLAGAAVAHALCAESYRCATDWVLTVEVIRDETAKIYEGVEDVFYVGVPEPTRWLEVSGPVMGAVAAPGPAIPDEQQTMTGCHLWTDDFDSWCADEFAPDWGMKSKVGGACPGGQGRAECSAGFKGGVEVGAGEFVTGCHLWTDDFDAWCSAESKRDMGVKEKIVGGCMTGQGKARCAAGYAGGAKIVAGTKLTGCHLWTDDFGWWCHHEFGPAYSLQSKDGHGCMIGQGKGVCGR